MSDLLTILKNKYLWLLLAAFTVAFVSMRFTAMERDTITYPEVAVREVFASLQDGFTGFGMRFTEITSIFASKRELLQQIEALENQNKALSLENQALQEYRAEALRLRTCAKQVRSHPSPAAAAARRRALLETGAGERHQRGPRTHGRAPRAPGDTDGFPLEP